MMTIRFETSNAAFEDDIVEEEIEAVLERVMEHVRMGYTFGPLHDTNGNTIGSWDLEPDH